MHFTTHILMANVLYKHITKEMGIKLDYFQYVYGNIKPDFNPGTMDFPHYLEDSLDAVINYCEYIMTTPLPQKAFSAALGIVSHFVCDYYCLYHTEQFKKKSLLVHTLYEHFLELHFIKKCVVYPIKITEKDFSDKIEVMIRKRCELYHNEDHSLDKDLQYAVNTAIDVVRKIIELSQLRVMYAA